MRLRVLGPVEIVDGTRCVVPGGRRQAQLLALLLVSRATGATVDWLVTEIWGEDADSGAVASLYTHVSNLRRVLGKHRVVRSAIGYQLGLQPDDDVDVDLFESAAASARRLVTVDPAAAIAQFDEALRLVRGRPYEGLEDLPALVPEISRLEELEASLRIGRIDAILSTGDTPAVGEVMDLRQRLPFDETAWGLVIRALYRAGRPAEALHACREMETLFRGELGIEPSSAIRRLEEQILVHDPALDATAASPPSNLPRYLTAFFGRTLERHVVGAALGEHPLVTLTGPGGVGKTRLAVEVASSRSPRHPDGIWLIDLANVADEAGIGPAIAAAVGAAGGTAGSVEAAAAALSGRRCLLILDNCEHLVAGVRRTARALLDASPGIVILATSRIPLGLAGEIRVALGGLESVGAEGSRGEAAELFIDRVRSIRSGWHGGAVEAAAIEQICRRLDGIPLAIELAAGRADVLSVRDVADLLARRYDVLTDGARDRDIHQSLEATIGWSYNLLAPPDRTAFAALGAFEGTFDRSAARDVLGLEGADASLAAVDRLVNASLLTVVPRFDGSSGYRMLETLRLYARERLSESGQLDVTLARHQRYHLERCQALGFALLVRRRPLALQHVADMANELDAVWERTGAENPVAILPVAWALANHWLMRGGVVEGEARIGDLLAGTTDIRSHWRVLVLAAGAWLASRRGKADAASARSDESVALADALGDPRVMVVALNMAAQLRIDRGEPVAARKMLHRSLDLLGELEQRGGSLETIADGRSWALVSLGEAERWSGASSAQDRLYDVRRQFIEIGDPEGLSRADRALVTMLTVPFEERERLGREMLDLALKDETDSVLRFNAARAVTALSSEAGDHERAIVMCRSAVRSALACGSLTDLGSALLHAGMAIGSLGDPSVAARLIGAGGGLCGLKPGPHLPANLRATATELRRQLGDRRYRELRRLGAAMTPLEAATLVL